MDLKKHTRRDFLRLATLTAAGAALAACAKAEPTEETTEVQEAPPAEGGKTVRLAVRGEVSRAWSTSGFAPYATGSVLARWNSHSSSELRTVRLQGRMGVATASSSAPLLLWPAAGTGAGGAYLLRAHPLLDEGVITGKGLARELTHGGFEIQLWPWAAGFFSLGIAVFLDVAQPGLPFASAAAPLQADIGAGLRAQLPMQSECLRLDVARGTRDGQMAVSIGVESDRLFHD